MDGLFNLKPNHSEGSIFFSIAAKEKEKFPIFLLKGTEKGVASGDGQIG